jgi:uncharacterized repeat protein (TIGR03833 family)
LFKSTENMVSWRNAGKERSRIKPGMLVRIVLKKDQRSGTLTEGIVESVLTSAQDHPHGIKVRLLGGHVGRVKAIAEPDDGQS